MFTLYDYYRSSTCFRVRIALNLKAQDYTCIPVHLIQDGGQHLQAKYRAINPQGLVPSLEIADTHIILTQSMAILEYLEETFTEPPLLPTDTIERAKIRAFSNIIACDIHPINNLRILKYLQSTFAISETQKTAWYHHWLTAGFTPLEQMLQQTKNTGPYCFGNTPTFADICLIPQVYNAIRFELNLQDYPRIEAIYQHCLTQPAFERALPENEKKN